MHQLARWLSAALFVALASAPAAAEWHSASSRHFLIYGDDSPDRLRELAINLERFDFAARALLNMGDLPVSQGNRLTIFVLPNEREVQRLAGDTTRFVSGFYRGRAEGSIAYIPRKLDSGSKDDVYLILLHEYSHHLMFQDLRSAYPEWLIEGFAEFLSTAKFERNGAVGLGLPAAHRAFGLLQGKPLPLETLLSGRYEGITKEQRESIYGRGWLLTHYLYLEPSRSGQLTSYLKGISNGLEPLEAASQAFGDLKKLDKDLNAYLRRSRLAYRVVNPGNAILPPVEVSRLSPGAAEVLPLLAEVKNEGRGKNAVALAARARVLAGKYPGDLMVETTLAEAELNVDRFEAADAAADRALKADPRNTEAMILKGRAVAERAASAGGDSHKALFAEARKLFIAANTIDPEDPEPLMEFYKTYVREGVRPTTNAIEALHYASTLAPQDVGLRMNSAIAYLNENKLIEARRTLAPVAYSPHGGEASSVARVVISKIDAGEEGGAVLKAAFNASE